MSFYVIIKAHDVSIFLYKDNVYKVVGLFCSNTGISAGKSQMLTTFFSHFLPQLGRLVLSVVTYLTDSAGNPHLFVFFKSIFK